MSSCIDDLTELIRYHLVLAEVDDEKADENLRQLVRSIETMMSAPAYLAEPVYWTACEECGAWVSSELIGPDGAGVTDDGGFYCTSCRFGDED